jgi:hypothetical protein
MNSVATLSILDEIFFHLSESERSFFCFLDDESEKITTFYQGKKKGHNIQSRIKKFDFFFFCIEKEYEARLKLDAIKLQIKVVTEYSRFLLNNTVR